MLSEYDTENTRVRADGDKLLVDVPWERAEHIQSHLQSRGIQSVLCADAAERRAHLELPPGSDQMLLSEVLSDGAS